MGYLIHWVSPMSIGARLIALRKEKGLTQQEMADEIGLHVNQIRRYESGSAQPSLEALKKMAVAMSVTIDSLVFGPGERGPDEDLRLQFEAVSQMTEEEKKIIKALLEGMIVKHQTRKMVSSLSG
jgi:transcriptional regulator with XRE-family HTH domain